jgi:hypothetical protein
MEMEMEMIFQTKMMTSSSAFDGNVKAGGETAPMASDSC